LSNTIVQSSPNRRFCFFILAPLIGKAANVHESRRELEFSIPTELRSDIGRFPEQYSGKI
jgi:hypothetical protein